MSLQLYVDLMSQPCRALVLFCKINRIPYTLKQVALRKFEQQTEEYGNINPMRKVPAIIDGDFKLTESVAILKYLADKYNCPDHWYPRDLERRAKVDEYMSWQHLNTRMNCAKVFIYEVMLPRATGSEPDAGKLSNALGEMEETLTNLEKIFLKDKPFLCGSNISIADLLGVCEVEQVTATGRDVSVAHPRIGDWIQRVRQQLNPDYDDVHKLVYKLRDMNTSKAKL